MPIGQEQRISSKTSGAEERMNLLNRKTGMKTLIYSTKKQKLTCAELFGSRLKSFAGDLSVPNNHTFPSLKADAEPVERQRLSLLKRPTRVLAFIEARWPTTGPAKNLIDFARHAASSPNGAMRAIITVATYHRGSEPAANDFVRACEKFGLEVHPLHERFLFDPLLIPAIHKLIAFCDPDIVQSHAVKSHFLMRLAAIHRERHWIAFHHGYTWTSSRTKIYNQLDRWSLRAAHKVVTVCRPFASELERIGVRPERIFVRHNSVKAFTPALHEVAAELRRSLGISEDTQVILCAGRLSREKAQGDLIEAAALLWRENSRRKLRFVMAGDGPDLQMLKEKAKSLFVEDWFVFTGQIADLVPFYTMANLAVLPSRTEGSPNVLLEAMAAGLPIIATSVGGVPEIVENDKQALLVAKQNPGALARAIDRMLKDTTLQERLSAAARQSVAAYSPEVYRDSILSLYHDCLCDKL